MKHIVLIDESYPINTRNRRILDSLSSFYKDSARLEVITWDRNNEYKEELAGYHVYKKASAYGNRVQKFFNMWGFYRFCRSLIRQMKPDVVIASHWNNLLMMPKLDPKSQMLIYENLDMPSGPFVIRKCTSTLEKLKMREVNLTVHASRFFATQYPTKYPQIILENKPTFKAESLVEREISFPIRVAFIGILRYIDILKNLMEALRDDMRFQLYFHGSGHAQNQLKKLADKSANIFFTGYYAYEDVPKLYEQTDIVWAAYPNKDFNVKYAISNKFHESIMLGVPAVYASQTCLGVYAAQQNIGLEIDPYSVEAIRDMFNQIADGRIDLALMKSALSEFCKQQTSWEEDFKSLTCAINQFFEGIKER